MAISRLSQFASLVDEALENRDDEGRVLRALAQVWPDQLRERAAAAAGKRRLADAFRSVGATSPVVAGHFGHQAHKKVALLRRCVVARGGPGTATRGCACASSAAHPLRTRR